MRIGHLYPYGSQRRHRRYGLRAYIRKRRLPERGPNDRNWRKEPRTYMPRKPFSTGLLCSIMQECRLFSAPAAGGTAPPIRKRTSGRTKRSVRNGLRTGTDRIANRSAVLSLPRFVSTPVVAPGFHIATHLGPFLVLGIGQHGLDLLVHFLPLLGARLTSVVPGQEKRLSEGRADGSPAGRRGA